jgi:hypothetical protein
VLVIGWFEEPVTSSIRKLRDELSRTAWLTRSWVTVTNIINGKLLP